MSDFTFHLVCEEIAKKEGLEFKEVAKFLRDNAEVTFSRDEEINADEVSLA